jgi:hypothetical protein
VLLDEPVTLAALGGLALILLGVALGSGQRLLGPASPGDEADSREQVDPAPASPR